MRALHEGPRAKTRLVRDLGVESARAEVVLESLVRDGLVIKMARSYALSGDDSR
jgi:predicted transcriptional regulator